MVDRRHWPRIVFVALGVVMSLASGSPSAIAVEVGSAVPTARAAPTKPAAFDSAAALAKARVLNEALRLNDATKFWTEFDEAMRSAMGADPEKFGQLLSQIRSQTGPVQNCVKEEVAVQGGYLVYLGTCRFEKAEIPLIVQYAFDSKGKVSGFFVKPEAKAYETQFLDYVTKTPLRLPFHGEWVVVWGGRTIEQNYHAVARDQRFAYDLVVVRDSAEHAGSGRLASDYFAFGAPIVAPAAGKVVWVSDGMVDNRPGQMNAAQPIGNGVVLDHGNGEFSVFAHFQRGSVKVKLDQSVAEGDTLGRCGSSGNSSQPHLHYHLQNGPTPFEADGLPARFVDYVANGKPIEKGEPVRGDRIRRK